MEPPNRKATPVEITFTSDFRELVQGDGAAGPCVLRYDPSRLASKPGGGDGRRVRAYVRFHPGGGEWEGQMTAPSKAGMLETRFDLATDCRELEVWFSSTHADGQVEWDSKFGRNYWLRFRPREAPPTGEARASSSRAKLLGPLVNWFRARAAATRR